MNTLITGRIYHVIDKTTGEVVKVGSTIASLKKRWWAYNKDKYSNHFLKEIRTIESTDLDWYETGNRLSPFMWHLVAAEHLEMLKMNTFKKNILSNKQSPLDQKCFGFDPQIGGTYGGPVSGANAFKNKTGVHAPGMAAYGNSCLTTEDRIRGGKVSAAKITFEQRSKACYKRNALYGNPATKESCAKGGQVVGRANVENGHLAYARSFMTEESMKRSGHLLGHRRWHVSRGIVSPSCIICQEEN
jgi:hypothetical protein